MGGALASPAEPPDPDSICRRAHQFTESVHEMCELTRVRFYLENGVLHSVTPTLEQPRDAGATRVARDVVGDDVAHQLIRIVR